MRSIALSAIAALALSAGGCGLISSDVTNFDLTLPDKTFTVDTAHWMLTDADKFTSTDCSSNPGACNAATTQVCKSGQCFGSCSTTTQTCDLKVLIGLYQTVNLLDEKPELKTINDQPLIGVHIDKIEYQVTENTLNVATPEMVMYVAPATKMAPGDPESVQIGVIPAIAAGKTQAIMTIEIGADGQAALADKMGDYMKPFNIIVGSSLDVKSGDVIPQGRLTAKVKVTAHAQLGG
jgi:hypothetical protein